MVKNSANTFTSAHLSVKLEATVKGGLSAKANIWLTLQNNAFSQLMIYGWEGEMWHGMNSRVKMRVRKWAAADSIHLQPH